MKSNSKKGTETLVVAFDTTASALAFDSAARKANLPGRLFTVPRQLSAGCGMAWRSNPETRPSAEQIISAEAIDDARIVIMELP